MNPQTALDVPRWRFLLGKSVLLEATVPDSIARALAARSHDIQISEQKGHFGKGQIILHREGLLVAASEARADGLALAQ